MKIVNIVKKKGINILYFLLNMKIILKNLFVLVNVLNIISQRSKTRKRQTNIVKRAIRITMKNLISLIHMENHLRNTIKIKRKILI